MPQLESIRYNFNRGVVSALALGRIDLKRNALSAEIQENFTPRTLGPMMLRAGLKYIGTQPGLARHVEFVRSATSMHVLEFTTLQMRVWSGDALVNRVAVGSAVAGATFPSAASFAANWTNNDEAGATSAWIAAGQAGFTGTGTAAAIRDQAVTTTSIGTEHALRINIVRGPILFRCGSAVGLDDYIAETTLNTGYHSLAFTPTASPFYVRFLSRLKRTVIVGSCDIENAGILTLPAPYGANDLDHIRAGTDSLSVDVMFVGCAGVEPRRIERRNAGRSWSVALYQPEDGPFKNVNSGATTLAPSALSGNGTLTASTALFYALHVGCLFRLESTGQTATKSMTLLNDATGSIRVVGITTDRTITISLSGMTVGRTVVLEYSTDNLTWIPVPGKSWTADTVEGYTDGLNNQIIYYRLRCSVVGAAGPTAASVSIPTGTVIGTCRVTGYTSATQVAIEILTDFGSTTATAVWQEGSWSGVAGYPSACALYEGRLAWGGYDQIAASVTDAFDSFEPQTVGDSGPINRSIGSGPMDVIHWILPLQRLLMGALLGEHSVRSNAFDEPITPSNFNRKRCSSQGSENVQAVSVDNKGLYVQCGGTRIFELAFDGSTFDYGSTDLTLINPDICKPKVVRMAIQRKPDTRLHCVLSDGTVAMLVYDKAEQVACWVKITTSGLVKDVVVLPAQSGQSEDQVYYQVARTVGGATVYYFEKWATEDNCQGGTLNHQADSYIIATAAGNIVSGMTHLIGQSVVCWADGKDLGTFVVDGTGAINVGQILTGTTAIAGLYYEAKFKSAKLGDTIGKQKNFDQIAPVLHNTHCQGFKYGPDFTNMDNLPLMVRGAPINPDTILTDYDDQDFEFDGVWDADARLHLKAWAPRPCTVLAVAVRGQVSA